MKNILKKLKKNWVYFKGFKALFILGLIFKTVIMVVNLIIPIYYSQIVTSLVDKDMETLKHVLKIIVSLNGGIVLIGQINSRIQLHVVKGVNYNMTQILMNQLMLIPPNKLKQFNEGRIYALLTADSAAVSSYVYTVVDSFFNAFSVISIGVIILFLSWKLAIVVVLAFPITYFINYLYSKKIKRQAIDFHNESDKFVGFYSNMVINLNELKSINATEKINDVFRTKTGVIKKKAIRNDKTILRNSFFASIIEIANYVVVTIVGALLVIGDKLKLGDFVAFGTYSANFSSSLSAVVNLNASLQPTFAILERIDEFEKVYNESVLDEQSKGDGFMLSGDVCYNNISLSLSNKQILKDINSRFEAQKINGVMGQNGSGKTTLFNLLTCLYEADAGTITIGGHDIKSLKYSLMQSNICYIRQNPTLFRMTLLDNLLLFNGSKQVTLNEVRQACDCVNLLEDIDAMPQGFDTVLDENRKLSVGQAQKLQLARAILMDRSIILVDEATVNLDHASRQKVYDVLSILAETKTIIFVTNNEAEKEVFDTMFVLPSIQ